MAGWWRSRLLPFSITLFLFGLALAFLLSPTFTVYAIVAILAVSLIAAFIVRKFVWIIPFVAMVLGFSVGLVVR